MRLMQSLDSANRVAAAALAPVHPAFLAALRVYVSWQFLKSGWLKVQDWDTTRVLFEEEYHVPLLSPVVAAALGTAGELVFPVLLIAGLLGRYAAAGLSAVNLVAVLAYAHVLTSDGFEAALGQHYFWGLMLATLLVFGPGRWSVDGWLERRPAARRPAAG